MAGWKATKRLLERGRSWSGHERNCVFLNCRDPQSDPRFANVSAATGLDFADDGRGLAVVDWDHDGDLDLWFSNRTAPRLRFMRNDVRSPAPFVSLRLRGTTCNRDAIGARVEVELYFPAESKLVQTLGAGDGFLSQSTKWLHFGLGGDRIRQVVVRWPGGESEEFSGVGPRRWFELTQGSGKAVEWIPPKRSLVLSPSEQVAADPVLTSHVLMPTPFPMPALPYTDLEGTLPYVEYEGSAARVVETRSKPLLVNLWASWCAPCVAEMEELTERATDLREAGVDVLALSVDGLGQDDAMGPADAAELRKRIGYPFDVGMATVEMLDKIERVQRFLFGRRPVFAVPMSLLLDRDGRLAAIYRGRVGVERLLRDVASLKASPENRRDLSVPFAGRWVDPPSDIDLSLAAGSFHDLYPGDTLSYLGLSLEQQESLREQYADSDRIRSRADRNRAEIHHQMALLLKQLSRVDDAVEHCRGSLSIDPKQAPVQLFLGELLSEKGDLEQAIEPYEAARRIDPTLTAAHFGLGLAHGKLGQYEQALEIFEMLVKALPDNVEAYLNLGTALEQLGRDEEAIERYRQAVKLDPDRAEAHHKLSALLAKQGKLDEAIAHLRVIVRLHPNAFYWHYVLGRLLDQEGRVTEALDAFSQAHQLNPKWVPPLNGMAWILATHPDPELRDEPEAVRLAEAAVSLTASKSSEILDTLAAAYAAVDDYDRAVSTAQQAIEMGPKDSLVVDAMRKRLELYKQQKPYRESGKAQEPDD